MSQLKDELDTLAAKIKAAARDHDVADVIWEAIDYVNHETVADRLTDEINQRESQMKDHAARDAYARLLRASLLLVQATQTASWYEKKVVRKSDASGGVMPSAHLKADFAKLSGEINDLLEP